MSGIQQVALDADRETEASQDVGDVFKPQDALVKIRTSALEAEFDVVVARLVTAIGVNNGKMIAESHHHVQIAGGNDGIAGNIAPNPAI